MTPRQHRDWGEPAPGPAAVAVQGDDAALAAAAAAHPGALVHFTPVGSDLARATGLEGPRVPTGIALPLDGIALDGELAVNMIVLGRPPPHLRWTARRVPLHVTVDGRAVFVGRATGVVIANGEFLRGFDVVPRGHPGDGRLEVQVYALRPGERRSMRRRLSQGAHLPHPRITTATGRAVAVRVARGALDLEVDGVSRGRVARLEAAVVPAAVRLLV